MGLRDKAKKALEEEVEEAIVPEEAPLEEIECPKCQEKNSGDAAMCAASHGSSSLGSKAAIAAQDGAIATFLTSSISAV